MNATAAKWRPWVVVVGGFLGAGKTSLILAACALLEKRRLRCAAILNDQDEGLVDTQWIEQHGIEAGEVAGGCFCCRFTELLIAFDKLRAYAPDVIFVEPVGSCTDIVATVLRPLHEDFEICRLAPFTVLVDPVRLAALLRGNADEDIAFLMRKQMEEADLICLTKSDLHSETEHISGMESLRVSARTGAGVQEWIDHVLSGFQKTGSNVLDIDYGRYAQAEAALAWLNLSICFEPAIPLSPALVAGPLLEKLEEAMSAAGVSIVHLKLMDRSVAGWVKAAICENGGALDIEGNLDAGPANRHDLSLNLRAISTPAQLRKTVEEQMRGLAGTVYEWHMSCFSPSPPVPERRIGN